MSEERERIEQVSRSLRDRLGAPPPTLLTLGSGLGPVVDALTDRTQVGFRELGLPESTVPGHAGQVVCGVLNGARVAVLSGRVHAYEGYSFDEVVRYVRAAHRWGVGRVILTCSAGSTRAELPPGTLTLLRDHLNLMPGNPLVGPPIEGVRFPDASKAHDPAICDALRTSAAALGLSLPEAVYAAFLGPAYETAAEVSMVRILGGDLVGMSTVPELLAAARLGLPAAALAVVSNYGAGVGESEVDHGAVTRIAGQVASQLAALLSHALPALDAGA